MYKKLKELPGMGKKGRKERKEEGGLKPNTLHQYIHTLDNFCEFLLMEVGGPTLGIDNGNILRLRSKCTWYKKRLMKANRSHVANRHAHMQDHLLETANVTQFRDIVKKDAAMALETMRKQASPKWSCIVELRNHLILEMCLQNANRAGVIRTMTVGDVTQITVIEGSQTIKVKKHKTLAAHGAAHVVLDDTTMQKLQAYWGVRKYTPHYQPIQEQNEEPFFLSAHGKEISNPGQILDRLWTTNGFTGSFQPTILRKTVVTKAREKLSAKEVEDLASHMSHSSTQSKYYYAGPKETTHGQCSTFIGDMWGQREGINEHDDANEQDANEQDTNEQDTNEEDANAEDEYETDEEWTPPRKMQRKQNKNKRKVSRLMSPGEETLSESQVRFAWRESKKKTPGRCFSEVVKEVYDRLKVLHEKVSLEQFYDRCRHQGYNK